MNGRLRRFRRRIRYWLRRSERHRLLQQEMEFHLDSLAQDLMDQGIPEHDARAAARRQFGNLTLQQEDSRATWIARWMSDASQDLRYTFRTLRRDAGFTTFAILIMGLGIGASTTIFSVVNALLLRPLPFRDAGSLLWLANSNEGGLSGQTIQVGHFNDFKEQNHSFSDMAAYFAFYGVGDNKLTGRGEPERLSGVPVSQNFFSLLGVQPQLGRLFNAEEAKWKGPKVVLLGNGLWKRRFDSDPGIVGRTLILNDDPYVVIGVMPESWDFASVFAPGSHIDLYFPFPLTQETNRWGNTIAVVARLKPGVTMASAQAEANVLGPHIRNAHPERNGFTPQLSRLEDHVSGRLRPALLVLACAVGVVMLIVCANLSNLQLARTATRQKEMAVRAALGAGSHRLIRQMLTESVVLACCGAVLGLILAVTGTKLIGHMNAISIPLLGAVHIDGVALAFTSLIAIATGLILGLVPALQVRAGVVHDALKESNRGSSDGKHHAWIRGSLVVSEIAFACVLLVGAGLLIRSFLAVLDVNMGFHPESAAAMRIDPSSAYSGQAKVNAYFDEALRRVKEIPGVQAAGLSDALPLGRNRTWGAGVKGKTYRRGEFPFAFVRIVSDGYFQAMGIPMRVGRDFTERDNPQNEKVIIINETMAKKLFPGEDPLGKVMSQDGGRKIIGVVGDVRHLALEQESGNEMYLPIRQTDDFSSVDLVVRSSIAPASLASAVRNALKPIEPNLPANEFRTLQQLVDKAVSPRRFVVLLLGGFAGFALILASLGIYGVISYSVTQRTQEIGIRMALGASAGNLQGRILLQTLALGATGMVVGVAASWILARTIKSLLYGVTSNDPVTFAGMLLVLTIVAGIAGYLPARRASRIDPMVALRNN